MSPFRFLPIRRPTVSWLAFLVASGLLGASLGAATVTVLEPTVVLRSGPGVDHAAVDKMAKGEVLEVLRREGDWYKVSRYGSQGWVFTNLVSEPTGPIPEGTSTPPAREEASVAARLDPAPSPLAGLPPGARDNILRTSKGDVVVEEYVPGREYEARIVTRQGTIVLKLWADAAPNHVKNFIHLSRTGFYDGLTFHRVIAGFLIQGGDPNGDGAGGPGYAISQESTGRSHGQGVISMARRIKDPDSGGSQFFILLDDHPVLDGKYTPFGNVIEGMNVVRTLGKSKANAWDQPRNRLEILDVEVRSSDNSPEST